MKPKHFPVTSELSVFWPLSCSPRAYSFSATLTILLPNTVATRQVPMEHLKQAREAEELNLFDLIFLNLNLNLKTGTNVIIRKHVSMFG